MNDSTNTSSTCTANDLVLFLETWSNSSWVSGSAVFHYTTGGFGLIVRFTAQIKTILYELSLLLIVKFSFQKFLLINYKLGYTA